MELALMIVLLMVVLGCGGLYLSDREGWNRTLARGSKIVRASVEAKKPVAELEVRDLEKQALSAWEAEFTGKQNAVEELEVKPKHYVEKTYYQKVATGEVWPHWKCACGEVGRAAVVSDGMKAAERRAKTRANDHVKSMNAAEELMKKNNGRYAF